MIKINLLKASPSSQVKKNATLDDFSTDFSSSDISDSSKSKNSPALKILILLLGPAALFAFEQQRVPVLQNQLIEKQHLLVELKNYNQKKEGAVAEIEAFKKNKEKIETQIHSIEALSQNRLLFVKTLETLQVGIPEKAWLTKITDLTNFKDDGVIDSTKPAEMPKYKLEIEGTALSEVEISNFIATLTKNIHFLDVNLISADEANEKHIIYGEKGKPQSLSVKKFKIQCSLDPNRDIKTSL